MKPKVEDEATTPSSIIVLGRFINNDGVHV